MKAITLTAVMALLVAIPLIFKGKRIESAQSGSENSGIGTLDEDKRYSIDEFLT